MDHEVRPDQQEAGEPEMVAPAARERDSDDAREEMIREGRQRAAIWGVLTGLVMTVVALGCILLLYLAVGR